MSELGDYQEMINNKAAENSTEVLPNAGKDHAAIVMSKLFDKTTKSVKMAVGSFAGPVSNQSNYLASLKCCVERNIPIQVIFLEEPNLSSIAYQFLSEMKANNYPIAFKKADEGFKEKLSKGNSKIHFAVFDDNKYRFEKDTVNI